MPQTTIISAATARSTTVLVVASRIGRESHSSPTQPRGCEA